MSYSDVLKLLSPIQLDGVFEPDIEVEGRSLDNVQSSAVTLLIEMFADGAYQLLPDFERVYGLTPGPSDTLQQRRDRVIRKMREKGGLSREYFIALALAMGVQITIDEMQPFRAGVNRAGDRIYVPEIIFVWRVNAFNVPEYYFRAGQSTAGERLRWWPAQTELEDLFQKLKPAWTYVYFNYAEASGGVPEDGLAIHSAFAMPF